MGFEALKDLVDGSAPGRMGSRSVTCCLAFNQSFGCGQSLRNGTIVLEVRFVVVRVQRNICERIMIAPLELLLSRRRQLQGVKRRDDGMTGKPDSQRAVYTSISVIEPEFNPNPTLYSEVTARVRLPTRQRVLCRAWTITA
jgi:hypothetical protein